ncbi:MAG TPA: hypothetical protein VNF71_15920 [Acidimicrobiales bacterium]|nr:hypothetical protein [Acidimicrobiales bacterium]
MSIASELVVAGRRRVRTQTPARVVARGRAAAENKTGTTQLAVAARGVLWAALLLASCVMGSLAVGLVVVPAAVIASVSALRAVPRPLRAPAVAVAVGGPIAAAISFIVADAQGANLGLTLAFVVCLYDAASYLNGNGRGTGGWPGVGAGLLTVGVLAVFVAAVLVPPFTGTRSWLVVGMTGLVAPVGVWLAGRATGWDRLPALRRVDSMILAAPVWAILVSTVVQR